MSETETPEPIVRHFRQVLLWPLQLMPLSDNGQVHRHAEMLETWGGDNPWREVKAHGSARDCEGELLDTARSRERHYREFVTFLPHAQRFLYGQGRSSASLRGYGESPIRLFRRSDITHARLTFDDGTPWTFVVEHMDLYFYHDVDVVMLAFEFHTDEIPLRRVQELLFRFGRTYPAQWDDAGIPDQCMRNVEWLDRSGEVLASSDFMEQQVFHRHVSEHREARIGRHWEFLLRPMLQHHSEHAGEIRYRQLEYHRLPKLTYLALDNPFALSREDFFRLGMATPPDDGGGLLYPEKSLEHFEREHCYDNFWVPARSDMRASTRIMGTARSMVMVGSARNAFYADRDTGMLGQFRHQYFLALHDRALSSRSASDALGPDGAGGESPRCG
jgi:hypothetical protein